MKKSILIVDNDVDIQDLLDEILDKELYDIHFYEDVDDIFPLIEKHSPKLILLDFNLNGINGGELCTMIKKNEHTRHIPVILFSAYPRIIYSLEHYGYDAFIEKPFDIDEFSSTIAAYTS